MITVCSLTPDGEALATVHFPPKHVEPDSLLTMGMATLRWFVSDKACWRLEVRAANRSRIAHRNPFDSHIDPNGY